MPTDVMTTLALKEWSAAVHALLDGRQTILLRKGGIHEKAFTVAPVGQFLLFPTVAHSHADRIRPEHHGLLAVGAADVDEDAGTFTVRCGVSLVDVVPVSRPEGLADIADLHIWTDDSVRRDRVDFRPRHALQILVVQAMALPEPVWLPRLEEYAGCRSWLDLPLGWVGAGRPVHDEHRLRTDAARVRDAVA